MIERKKCTFSFLASNGCRVVPPAVMDVWGPLLSSHTFSGGADPLASVYQLRDDSDFCNIRVKKKALGSVKYIRALVCCQCVCVFFSWLRQRLKYKHHAGNFFFVISIFFLWLFKNTDIKCLFIS